MTMSLLATTTFVVGPAIVIQVKTQEFRIVLWAIVVFVAGESFCRLPPGKSTFSTRTRSRLPGLARTTLRSKSAWSVDQMLNTWCPQDDVARTPAEPHPEARVGLTTRLSE